MRRLLTRLYVLVVQIRKPQRLFGMGDGVFDHLPGSAADHHILDRIGQREIRQAPTCLCECEEHYMN